MVPSVPKPFRHLLGYQIYLDRYSLKDLDRRVSVGQVVLADTSEDPRQSRLEVATVQAPLDGDRVELLLWEDGSVIDLPREKLMVPIEPKVEQMWHRVAKALASVEKTPELREHWEREFRWLLSDFRGLPGGRIMAGAGAPAKLALANCFVIPFVPNPVNPEAGIDSRHGILHTLSIFAELLSRGGGVGINISALRPRGAVVYGVHGTSSGSVSWAELFSQTVHLVQQGGSRRGAAMLILEAWHPDIEEFISAKTDFTKLLGFNISVGTSEEFEKAVAEDADWELVFPDYAAAPEAYDREWDGDLEAWRRKGYPVKVYKTVRARDLWDKIARSAWASGEPGIVRLGYMNRMSNSWYFARIIGTNPCVTGDTLVATDQGLVPIALLVDQHFRVAADPRLADHADYLPSSPAFCTGVKPVVRLTTREGFELRLTTDHKVRTPEGWVAAGDLKPGDRVLIHAGAGAFGRQGSLEEGRILGWFVGDGGFSREGESEPLDGRLYFYGEKRCYAPLFEQVIQAVVRPAANGRSCALTAVQITRRKAAVIGSHRLAEWVQAQGLSPESKLSVPSSVLQGSAEMQQGFLQALFTADGTLLRSKGVRELRLTSVSLDLLRQVQLLLLNFGVFSRIYKNRRGARPLLRLLPDGRGGRKPYRVQPVHELVVSGADLVRFADAVGLLPGPKHEALSAMASSYARRPWARTFEAHVESVTPDGTEPVFDLSVPGIHAFSANGVVVHNCGEQPLPPWGICDLGHINLPKFLAADGTVDYNGLRRAIRAMVRLLDNAIDLAYYPHPAIKERAVNERRVGMGTLGLGELLLRMGIRYGSPEALRFIDELYRFIAREAYLASVDLAGEKGAFPAFDARQFVHSGFMASMDEDVRQAVMDGGIRNVTLLTQAPTGTSGTMVGTSTGIEPYYDWHYTRRGRFGAKTIWEPVYLELINPNPDPAKPDPLPEHWVTAKQLTVEEHVRMLAAIQRWVDSSVSKTLNAPASATVEDIKKAYDLALQLGVKAIAIYRDRSRDTQVLESATPQSASKPASAPSPESTEEEEAPRPRHRPSRVRGFTEKIPTSSGKLYVTVNYDEDGQPIEIFVTGGKQGGEVKAWAELAGRWGSLALAYGVPIAKLAHGARGIKGYQSFWYKPDYLDKGVLLHSGPDAVGFVLEHLDAPPEGCQAALPGIEEAPPPGELFEVCPSCGEALEAIDGCWSCLACGYSKCG